MLNSLKRKIIKIINSLEEATGEVEQQLTTHRYEGLYDILQECQSTAIQLGELIEAEEGEGTNTVSILERYCEDVYILSQHMEAEEYTTYLGYMKRDISELRNNIISDIPTKYEVVFFPYKASMWDSLESVWKAAKEDPACDTYVVPIPYFDKNRDKVLSEMHYEGNDYPEYVPITSWKDYSLENRHPDIVFIHNPYDNCNHVTSIHPSYYAKELKKITDLLVYIPYFVTLEDVPEHFCVLPGTMYADLVIVHSEQARETYIREFHKFEAENNCTNFFGIAEDKFIALGSPKFDKIRNMKKQEVVIPDGWNKLLYKPDGTKKKVILYNTTIQPLLTDNERYLDKLEQVLQWFSRMRENIILLWRPHPLMEGTISAIRPRLYERYCSITRGYIDSGYGIFDDSADLYQSIAISDAYYGDWSSVMLMYQKTGKPIMIQNVEVRTI